MAKRPEKAPAVQVRVVRKEFGKAPEEHVFALKDGRKLRTVFELIDALETMPDDVFRHHVTSDRNDFAAWLDAVFDEKVLAGELKAISGRMETQRAILKHLVREMTKHHKSCKGC